MGNYNNPITLFIIPPAKVQSCDWSIRVQYVFLMLVISGGNFQYTMATIQYAVTVIVPALMNVPFHVFIILYGP